MARAQSAAWEAYRAVTDGLLPTLRGDMIDGQAVKAQLGTVAIRILRDAPLWDEHGAMLEAALHSAMRLYRNGDITALAGLTQDISDRLYVLSASPGQHRHRSDEPAPP